jgi:hypothetical protein
MCDVKSDHDDGVRIFVPWSIAGQISEWVEIVPTPAHVGEMCGVASDEREGLVEELNEKTHRDQTHPSLMNFFRNRIVTLEHGLLEQHFLAHWTCVFARVEPVLNILVTENMAAS